MQVAHDDTPFVDRRDRCLHLLQDVEGPGGVGGDVRVIRAGAVEGVARNNLLVERFSFDEILDEELVAGVGEVVPDLGDHVKAGKAIEDGSLPAHAGHRVAPGQVETRMGPGLLEDKPLLTPVTDVDTAAVGEMQRLTDLIRHGGDGGPVPGFEMGRQDGRQRHPLRDAEHHVPAVRDQHAVGALDGQLQLAGGADAPALGKAPVPNVERPRRPAEIAQDVWAGLTIEQVSQLDEHGLELRFVGRVDGDELAAGPAVGVLRVRQEKLLGASDELEGDAARDAVVAHDRQHGLGVVDAGGDVHLPSLRGQGRTLRHVRDPVVELGALPPCRDWLLGKREIWIALPRRQVGVVVEGRVGQAIQLIGQFHGPHPCH